MSNDLDGWSVDIEEGVLVPVVGAVVREVRVRKLMKSNLDRLLDEGANLNGPNKHKKSLLAMLSLK